MTKALRKAALLALLPLILAACGVRGSLEPPAEAKQQGTATSPDAAATGDKSSAPPKPHRDFPLDPLLR